MNESSSLARKIEGLVPEVDATLRSDFLRALDRVRHNDVSPIPEGITLLEAERLARQREPGDGSRQQSVLEQLKQAAS